MDWAADVSSENRPGRHLLDGCVSILCRMPLDHPDDPSGSVWTDGADNVSRLDRSGAVLRLGRAGCAFEDEPAVPADVVDGRGWLAGLGWAKRRAVEGVDGLAGGASGDIQR
jgi:hypothetical protein